VAEQLKLWADRDAAVVVSRLREFGARVSYAKLMGEDAVQAFVHLPSDPEAAQACRCIIQGWNQDEEP
jgi:hypothetical protein